VDGMLPVLLLTSYIFFAARYVSSVVSASHYSGYSAVLACGSCKCLYAGVAGGSHSAMHVSASPPFFQGRVV
jgi:hypothetical protein